MISSGCSLSSRRTTWRAIAPASVRELPLHLLVELGDRLGHEIQDRAELLHAAFDLRAGRLLLLLRGCEAGLRARRRSPCPRPRARSHPGRRTAAARDSTGPSIGGRCPHRGERRRSDILPLRPCRRATAGLPRPCARAVIRISFCAASTSDSRTGPLASRSSFIICAARSDMFLKNFCFSFSSAALSAMISLSPGTSRSSSCMPRSSTSIRSSNTNIRSCSFWLSGSSILAI